jgi:hypothetical protein
MLFVHFFERLNHYAYEAEFAICPNNELYLVLLRHAVSQNKRHKN